MLLVRHAIKTGIAAAILAGIFQNSDLAHIQYPVMGLVATMLSSNLGDTIKASWGRLGGSVVGGLFAALLISTLGLNPVIAGLVFILSSLFCEACQWKALTSQAAVVSAIIVSMPELSKEPWQYTFDRVVDNGIGVIVATVVTLLFWPDNPRQTLTDNLVRVLQNGNQIFQTLIEKALKGENPETETIPLITEMTQVVQQSETLLNKSMYGMVGRELAQDNWSDLIATERKLRRHLFAMTQTLKEEPSQFILLFTEELRQLTERVSVTCKMITSYVQSAHTARQALPEPRLESDVQKITAQLNRIRTTGEIKTYALKEIIQVYSFLHILTRFAQELDGLIIKLRSKQVASRPTTEWRVKLQPIPLKQVKHILKTGVAIGLMIAIINFTQLPFGYYATVAVAVAMQPTLGKGLDAGKQRTICTGIGALVAVCVIYSFGGNPFTVGLGVGLTILLCSYFGFNQGYKTGCFLVAISIMVHGTQPDSYIWGRFIETFLGVVIAGLISVLIWPETASQKLDPSISQTLMKLGTLYEKVVNYYLQGLDANAATNQLSEEIRQSIQTQSSLQAETKLELIDSFKASQEERRVNFFISYEKTLFSNILSLQHATGQGDAIGISQPLLRELQDTVQATVLGFKEVAAAVSSQSVQRQLASPLLSFEIAQQKLEQLRSAGTPFQKYDVKEVVAFLSVLSTMKEIAENLKQMTQDWPS